MMVYPVHMLHHKACMQQKVTTIEMDFIPKEKQDYLWQEPPTEIVTDLKPVMNQSLLYGNPLQAKYKDGAHRLPDFLVHLTCVLKMIIYFKQGILFFQIAKQA